ncbi:MAG: asparaginase [Gammaproteobacteria bacterium]
MPLPKILVVSLGGTITMTRERTGGIVPTLSAADLVSAIPEIGDVARIEALSPMNILSASLSIDDIVRLARLVDEHLATGAEGCVVIQGTDTIEETAFLLDLLVNSDRPVVVTGAMRGPQTPGADGPANILAAVIVACTANASGFGTLVVLNDEIHAARFVQKSHTALPSAFTSPLAGPVGLVAEGKTSFYFRLPNRVPPFEQADNDAPVALIKIGMGDDGRLLKQVLPAGYRGLVVEGMGAGHVPASIAPIISEIIESIPVVLATRVHAGPAFRSTYAFAGSEIDLLKRGVIAAGALSGVKARLLLSLLLRGGDRSGVVEAFQRYG